MNEYLFTKSFPDAIKPDIFEITNYPSNILIQEFFNYIGSFIFSIFLIIYEKSQTQKKENDNETRINSGFLYNYDLIYYTKQPNESNIKVIIFISIISIISVETINNFMTLNLSGLVYWIIDRFFIANINLKLFGIPIYSHKKFSIVCILIFSTLFKFLSTYEIFINDEYNLIYKNHLFLAPIISIVYICVTIPRLYSICKIKWLLDYKYTPVSILYCIYSSVGIIFLLISSLISNFIKCVDKTVLNDIDLVCSIKIKTENETDYSFSYFFEKLGDKETFGLNILYIFLFLIKISLNALRLLFTFLIIKHLNPEYYLCSFEIYFFLLRFIDLIKAIITENDIKVPTFSLFAEIISLICIMIYLELIELKFCNLNRNLKKYIEIRSSNEYLLNNINNDENKEN